MELKYLLIYGMAVWRISSLLTGESGPRGVFERLRQWAGIEHEGMEPDNILGGILSCVWCASVWVAFFFTIFWLISPEWSLKVAIALSFSTLAILIDVFIKKNST